MKEKPYEIIKERLRILSAKCRRQEKELKRKETVVQWRGDNWNDVMGIWGFWQSRGYYLKRIGDHLYFLNGGEAFFYCRFMGLIIDDGNGSLTVIDDHKLVNKKLQEINQSQKTLLTEFVDYFDNVSLEVLDDPQGFLKENISNYLEWRRNEQ